MLIMYMYSTFQQLLQQQNRGNLYYKHDMHIKTPELNQTKENRNVTENSFKIDNYSN